MEKEFKEIRQQIEEVGGQLNNVIVHEFNPGNNGLVAANDIKAGDVVMFIPEELLISDETTLDSPSVKYL